MIFLSTTVSPSTTISPFLDFSNPTISIFITIGGFVLLAIGLVFYGWLASRILKKSTLPEQPFTLVDVGVASLLGAWLLWVIITSFGQDEKINLTIILLNSLLYFCLWVGLRASSIFVISNPSLSLVFILLIWAG